MGRIFYSQVHGILHNNADGSHRQSIIHRCREGEELDLICEPDNYYDPGAVKICRKNGEQIGYWEADGGRMAHDLSIGWTYRMTINEIYSFQNDSRKRQSLGVSLKLEVLTMSRQTEKRNAERRQPAPELPTVEPPKKGWLRTLLGL